jgi:biotin carboxyl carrier protein
MNFTYTHDGETYTVQLERLPDGTYRVNVSGRVYNVTAEAVEEGWVLSFPESVARTMTYVVTDGDTRLVSVRGETYTLTRESQRQGRRSKALSAHSGDVTAQMPGQVREVLISAGETVARGQALVILEAMKMEVRATAPADGKVKRVLVTAGDVVSRGQLLAQIE